MNESGEKSNVLWIIVGLVVLSVVLSGVSMAMVSGINVPDNPATKDDISELNSQISNLRQVVIGQTQGGANIVCSSLNASSVKAGETATISVTVMNIGDETGSKEISPKCDGESVGSQNVSLKTGESETITFEIKKNQAKNYAISALGVTSTLTVSAREYKTFKFGILGASNQGWCVNIYHAIQMAVDRVNSQGGITVNGDRYKVDYVYYDDRMNPDEYTTNLRRLVVADGIKHVIQDTSSNNLYTGKDFINDHKMLLQLGAAGGGIAADFSRGFRLRFLSRYAGAADLKWYLKNHEDVDKVGAIALKDKVCQDLLSGWEKLAEAAGVEYVSTSVEQGQVDMRAATTKLLEAGVDSVEIFHQTTGNTRWAKQLKELSVREKYPDVDIIFGGTCQTDAMKNAIGADYMEGWYYEVGSAAKYLLAKGDKELEEFQKKIRERFNEGLQSGYTVGWNSAMLLMNAIDKADTFDVEELVEYYKKLDCETAQEWFITPYSPMPNGDLFSEGGETNPSITMTKFKNGEAVPVALEPVGPSSVIWEE